MRQVGHRPSAIVLIIGCFALCDNAKADVKLPKVIGSHMVLQQKMPLPIWGTADPDEEVTVSIGNNTASTKAGADGKWSVKLKELAAGGHLLNWSSKERRWKSKLTDILVGEVWVASRTVEHGMVCCRFRAIRAGNCRCQIPADSVCSTSGKFRVSLQPAKSCWIVTGPSVRPKRSRISPRSCLFLW